MMNKQGWFVYVPFLGLSLIFFLLLDVIEFPVLTVLKPMPVLCLIFAVLLSKLSVYEKRLLTAALSLSALGDITLTLPVSHQMELGLGCFLVAHLFYIMLFSHYQRDVDQHRLMNKVISVVIVLSTMIVLMLIWPYLLHMTLPVTVYVSVITIMALMSMRVGYLSLMGAALFLLSDSMLAFEEFVYKPANLFFWIMLSYYAAQMLLVTGFIRQKSL